MMMVTVSKSRANFKLKSQPASATASVSRCLPAAPWPGSLAWHLGPGAALSSRGSLVSTTSGSCASWEL
eukprot:629617-Rhodomonas_salina.1